MKCKQHPFERGPGVCAPCLRDRLVAVILAEARSASGSAICSPSPSTVVAASSARVLQAHKQHQHHYARAESLPSSSDPPPLAFPRSVSPYVSHRRSVDTGGVGSPFDCPRRRGGASSMLFYSTPQVGPTAGAGGGGGRGSKKRWSVLSALMFRSGWRGGTRSDVDPYSDPPTSASNPSHEKPSSSSWFSWFGRTKSRKIPATSAALDSDLHNHPPFPGASGNPKPTRRRCRSRYPRGMSPDTSVAGNDDYDDSDAAYYSHDRSNNFTTASSHPHSEYSTTTDFSSASPAWRIPGPTPVRKTPAGRHVSGFAVCLSPLVWASPGHPRRNSQVSIDDAAFSGELKPGRRGGGICRNPQQPRHCHHGSDGAVLGHNRSRKLVDLGAFR